eukprot:CAMPEP_0176427782 /NCGR_PEP_ID=MMETSP0127-20121128/12767_1 /TAXON_ID=938130 /ORGANISM="Platyophrya macrostoma, Strain WH" /LENGTH=82 /DNA_ID=CAMNT_0017809355 /DNA_START=243 /DNA_END=488 /DNA_ORIENTATION=+
MRIAIRGASVIRGALWAPCFLQPSSSSPPIKTSDDEETVGITASRSCSNNVSSSWGPQDYRMALAAWTDDMVVVYTTDMSAR